MSKKTKFIDTKRRGFLQGSALLTATAATGGAAVANAAAKPAELLPVTDDIDPRSADAGYEETEKVREYYRRARMI